MATDTDDCLESRRPNVVLIVCDQFRGDCLGYAGHPDVKTPYLDTLAAQGTFFENGYSACPSCIPARASLLTGKTPRHTGRVGYQDGIAWRYDHMMAEEFSEAGYQTACVGKMHVHPPRLPAASRSATIARPTSRTGCTRTSPTTTCASCALSSDPPPTSTARASRTTPGSRARGSTRSACTPPTGSSTSRSASSRRATAPALRRARCLLPALPRPRAARADARRLGRRGRHRARRHGPRQPARLSRRHAATRGHGGLLRLHHAHRPPDRPPHHLARERRDLREHHRALHGGPRGDALRSLHVPQGPPVRGQRPRALHRSRRVQGAAGRAAPPAHVRCRRRPHGRHAHPARPRGRRGARGGGRLLAQGGRSRARRTSGVRMSTASTRATTSSPTSTSSRVTTSTSGSRRAGSSATSTSTRTRARSATSPGTRRMPSAWPSSVRYS